MIVYRESSTLARDLGVELGTLYALSNHLSAHYRRVSIPKKQGGQRRLLAPDEALKAVQRRINERLLAYMPLSPYAFAYRPGGGAVKNAACHVGREQVLRLDILHFFDSIRYSAVKDAAFPPEIYAEPLRVLLTMLCYYQDALPQGAPTSPAIANLVLRDFDLEIAPWCRRRGIVYTRYCDDLVFSGDGDMAAVQARAENALRRRGFFLRQEKTVLRRRDRRQTVTGLTVNDKVSVPPEARRALRQEVYYCRRYGAASHLERTGGGLSPEAYLTHLLGRVNYLLQADPANREFQEARRYLLAASGAGENRR